MAIGNITKQLAGQAFDALRSSPEQAAAQPAPDNPAAVMLGQVQAMQKALREDEELLVTVHVGAEIIRVLEFFTPGAQVVVIKGLDMEKNVARVVSSAEGLQLVCKPRKASKPVRIAFTAPKPKSE